jgi:hypothetical protein
VKFRETMWFKKGLLDDTMPIEDRYLDDGSLTPTDSRVFGLHTGTTQPLPVISPSRRRRCR